MTCDEFSALFASGVARESLDMVSDTEIAALATHCKACETCDEIIKGIRAHLHAVLPDECFAEGRARGIAVGKKMLIDPEL